MRSPLRIELGYKMYSRSQELFTPNDTQPNGVPFGSHFDNETLAMNEGPTLQT